MKPLFSILIANYNNGKFFEDCYKSIIAQTYENWEAIIVDDCSKDNSVEEIKKIVGIDSRFKIFTNDINSGCGFTKRKCTELSNGEICGFLDPDDAISETAIEEMVQKHLELPNVAVVYSNFTYCDENLQPQKLHKQTKIDNFLPYFFNLNGEVSAFSTFKNSFYKKTSGIDPFLQRAVDQDLYLKLYEEGEVFYLDRDFYKYRIHLGGISSQLNGQKALFWHWVAIIKATERRNINIENLFVEQFVERKQLNSKSFIIENLKKSRWLKLGYKLGLVKIYERL